MNRFNLGFESLESRENPSSLNAPQSLLSAVAADGATITGPFGGNVQISIQVHGNQVSESVVWTGPNGRTASESGSITYYPVSGKVSGSFVGIGVDGRSLSAVMSGTLSGNTLTETTTITGPNGVSTQHGVYVGGPNSLQSSSSLTGPQGKTVSDTALWTYNPANGTLTGSGELIGPNGKVIDWNHVFGVRV